MNIDDRDIVCETDLSDHEFEAALDAAIETGNPDARVKVVEMYYESRMETAYAYQRATSADSRFEVTYADNRAALARAEAAEAEAKAAADRIMVLDVAFSNSHKLNEHLGDENRALAARVAELEATLGRLDALAPDYELPDGAAVAEAIASGYILTAGCRDIHGKVAGVAAVERNNEMLRARVAELEAASDAQGWRPVTE